MQDISGTYKDILVSGLGYRVEDKTEAVNTASGDGVS